MLILYYILWGLMIIYCMRISLLFLLSLMPLIIYCGKIEYYYGYDHKTGKLWGDSYVMVIDKKRVYIAHKDYETNQFRTFSADCALIKDKNPQHVYDELKKLYQDATNKKKP